MDTFSLPAHLSRRRWSLFAFLALIYMLVYFYRVSLAVIAGDVSHDLQLTPEELGTLAGILFYVYAFAQLPLGPLIDRFGGRLVISGCGLLTTAGGLLFSQAQSYGSAMAARMLIGVGTASVLMATFAIFSRWYSRQEFGRASSLMIAFGNLGNLCGTAPLALGVAAIGWRASFLTIAVIQGLATLLIFSMVRDRPPTATSAAAVEIARPIGIFAAWRMIFSSGSFWLLGILCFFWYGNYLAVQGLWGGPYLRQVMQLSRTQSGQMLMCISVGFVVGSYFSDLCVRRLFAGSQKRMLIVGSSLLALLMTAFLGWGDGLPPFLLGLTLFLIGITVSSGVLIYPIIRASFPVSIVGTAMTSLNFFVLLGAAVTQQLMGIIIGAQTPAGGISPPAAYHSAFLLPIIGLVVAIALYTFARDTSKEHG
ncbi:MAG: MFS transporter [Deltaproteobacteria bacterium HGW-Deltaproteobacteria-4]|nr:MAG: MFS transporter [Deltaproteobacteria bacterium HGW-Deltaproteobacteria-4]